jgi:hypothetical protein
MSDIPYKNKINPKTKAIAIIIVLLIIGCIVGLVISTISLEYARNKANEGFGTNPRLQMLINAFADIYTLATSIICINIFLLLGLLCIYGDALRKTKSSFIFGLLLFIGVLFVQSILSLPLLNSFFSYGGYNLNLYSILPNIFETIALVILSYLSME